MTYFDLIPRNPVCPAAGQCRWTGQENRKQKNRKLKPLINSSYPLSYRIYVAYIYIETEREERYSCTR